MVIRDPEQLGAVVSPVRHQVLRTMSAIGPASVRELADRLGRRPESLYYHIGALIDADLLVQVDERRTGRRPEAVYDVVAARVRTDPTQSSPEYIAAMRSSVAALLRLADRQMQAALARQQESGTRRPASLRVAQLNARLSPAAVAELNRRLDEVLDFVHEHDDPNSGQLVSLTLAMSPVAPAG